MNYEDLILRTGGLLSPDECVELQEAAYASDGPVLEVGHYTGLSTIAISEGLVPGRKFVTVDNHQWRGVTREDYEETVGMGFVRRDLRPVHRHKISYTTGNEQVDLDLGKRHPDTFTLAIWER